VGVVGVGHIGKNHARLYAELPSAEFTAIYDTDRAVARQRATEFGVTAAASLEEFAGPRETSARGKTDCRQYRARE
jgi:predicted dehydrogenase